MPRASVTRQIRDSDVRAMLDFISELNSFEHPEDFRKGMLPGLRKLVPCEIVSYNEVEFDAGKMIALDDPPGSMIAGAPEIFVRLGHQNPLVSRYQRTRDGRPYKWSDLITRRELHTTDLYREAYAPMGVEYQMAFCLPAPPEVIIALALNRGRRDFSERDRGLLNMVRGPTIQAYRTVQRYAAVIQRLNALERGLERNGAGVVVLNGPADTFVSEEAGRLLKLESGSTALPRRVLSWLAELGRGTDSRGSVVPLLIEGDEGGAGVVVNFVAARDRGEPDALLVERAGELLTIPQLRAAGLTPRQAEVLRQVALGRTNAEIAAGLRLSPRTVQKHLENIYEKLGTRSRTEALLSAWSIAQLGSS